MNNADLKELLLHPKPVAYGETIFQNGIEAVIWRRLRQTALFGQDIGIVQAEVLDSRGSVYLLNPQRIRIAEPGEETVIVSAPTLFEKRLALLDVYRAWCEDNEVEETSESFMAFLYAEDLINARKAYDIIKSQEADIC